MMEVRFLSERPIHICPGGAIGRRTLLKRELLKVRILPGAPYHSKYRMKILIAGDSFAFGQGCSDRPDGSLDSPSDFCWASLLQQAHPTLTVVNKSLPGLDNTSILIKILAACTENTFDLIVFAGSYIERKQIAHPYNTNEITPWVPGWHLPGPEDYEKAQEYYVKYLSNTAIDINITTSNIMAAHGQSLVQGAKFLWSLPEFAPEDNIKFELLEDLLNAFQIKNVQDFDYSGVNNLQFNQQYECSDRHINDTGHRLYFERQIVPLFKELNIIA